jgi:hypothetical protein
VDSFQDVGGAEDEGAFSFVGDFLVNVVELGAGCVVDSIVSASEI